MIEGLTGQVGEIVTIDHRPFRLLEYRTIGKGCFMRIVSASKPLPAAKLPDGVRYQHNRLCRECEMYERIEVLDDHRVRYTHRDQTLLSPDDGWRWKLGYYHGWQTLEEVEEWWTIINAMRRPEHDVFLREAHR